MKETMGELNMTVVTVVAIAALGAFFYVFVWPSLKVNILNNVKCAQAICDPNCGTAKTCKCTYIEDEKGTGNGTAKDIVCPNNNAK